MRIVFTQRETESETKKISQNKQKCEAKENKNVIIISIIGSFSWFNHTKIISFGIRLRGGCVVVSLCVLVSVRNWNFSVLKFDRKSFKTQQKKQILRDQRFAGLFDACGLLLAYFWTKDRKKISKTKAISQPTFYLLEIRFRKVRILSRKKKLKIILPIYSRPSATDACFACSLVKW